MRFTALNRYLFLLLLVSVSKSFSQDTTSLKGDFEINLGYGNANITFKEEVNNGFYSSFKAKKEFLLHKNYSLISGLDLVNLHFNTNSYNVENKYIGIPLSFRTTIRNDKDAMFAEFGGYAYYVSNSNSTNTVLNTTNKEKNLGNTFGFFFKMGYKKYFNEYLKFNISIIKAQDFSSNYKKSVTHYEIKNQIGLELGLCLSL